MSRNSWYFYSYKSLLIVIIYQVQYALVIVAENTRHISLIDM